MQLWFPYLDYLRPMPGESMGQDSNLVRSVKVANAPCLFVKRGKLSPSTLLLEQSAQNKQYAPVGNVASSLQRHTNHSSCSRQKNMDIDKHKEDWPLSVVHLSCLANFYV